MKETKCKWEIRRDLARAAERGASPPPELRDLRRFEDVLCLILMYKKSWLSKKSSSTESKINSSVIFLDNPSVVCGTPRQRGAHPPRWSRNSITASFFFIFFFLHTYALHQIRCTLGAVFTGCALWAAARYLGPSACPASHSMPPGRGHG